METLTKNKPLAEKHVLANQTIEAFFLHLKRRTSPPTVPFFGYRPEALKRRILQEAGRRGMVDFCEKVRTRIESGGEPADLFQSSISAGGIKFEPSSGKVSVTFKVLTQGITSFILAWSAGLGFYLKSLFFFGARRHPATFVWGLGGIPFQNKGSDRAFLAFCQNGPIRELDSLGPLFVETAARGERTDPKRVFYLKRGWEGLFTILPRSPKQMASFLLAYILAVPSFFLTVARDPRLSLLWMDFVLHTPVCFANKYGRIKNIVLTNSDFSSQPLWMVDLPGRKFYVSMAWYSTNWRLWGFQKSETEVFYPPYRFMKVDRHYVWNEEQKTGLDNLGGVWDVDVVGPILFQSVDARPSTGPKSKILVFDVTPINLETRSRFSIPYTMYPPDVATRFVEDVLAAADQARKKTGKDLEVVLKHKRVYAPFHDRNYINFINRHEETGRLTPADPNQNLADMIAEGLCVIVIPFSSPANLAQQMGVPGAFYDPTGQLRPLDKKGPAFINDKEDLADWIAGAAGR